MHGLNFAPLSKASAPASARSQEWAAALRPAASDQHQLRPDRGNRLQRPGFRLAFGPCRRDRRPLRPGIVFGPTRRLRLAHAAPPARAPLQPNTKVACFGAKAFGPMRASPCAPFGQREGGLLRRQVRQQPVRAQRTAGTPNSKMLTLCVPAPALAAQVVWRHEAIVLGLAHNEATEHLVTCATLARDAIYLYRL